MRGVLLSGGVDSALVASMFRAEYAIHIDYGQSCRKAEAASARHIADKLAIPLDIISIDCRALGSGSLAGKPSLPQSVQPEWWPFRNQLLVTLAGMAALERGVASLMLGTVLTDRQFLDGTPEFIARLNELMCIQEGAISVLAPAMSLNLTELFTASKFPHEWLALTHSCHRSDVACGQCRGCHKRSQLFCEIGLETNYR